mgnify:CR=1 FL=1
MILSENHWRVEYFRERMTKAQWRKALLAGEDNAFVMGRKRQFVAKDLGYGIVEVSKAPLEVGAKDKGE